MKDSAGNILKVGDELRSTKGSIEPAIRIVEFSPSGDIAECAYIFGQRPLTLSSESMANSFWVLAKPPIEE